MPSRTGQVVLVQVNNPRRAVLLIRSDACQVGEELPRTNVEYQGMKMELYAGMVENMDMHVGRLVDYIKSIGEYENTIFIIFGDNGAEGTDLFEMIAGTEGTLNLLNAAEQQAQQAQTINADNKTTFDKAYGVCLQGRGYTVG